jgi:DNA phosphorothioation-associated putative methyltransferase
VDRDLDERETCSDGLLTGRGTFQKLYTQDEFRNYVESTLNTRLHTAALGIGYVFRDAGAEQRYLANKVFTRRLEYRTDLVAEFGKHPVAKRYVRLANKLGRLPRHEEFRDLPTLVESFGSPERIERLTLARVDRKAFVGSRAERRTDILVFLASLELQSVRPPPYSVLPGPIQDDVKAIWSSYSRALAEGHEFLFTLGQPQAVKMACLASTVGKLLPSDLYVHRSAEEALPALLRVVLIAAKRVVGEVEYDIAKVALDGRAVAFLRYEGFDDDPHPALTRSVRVHLPRASFEVRDYSPSANPPILHRKDALVLPSYPRYPEFQALTEQEESLGLLSSHEIGFRTAWIALLASRGLAVQGHRVRQAS